MKTIAQARSQVMAKLSCCPCCAAPQISAEKSDVLETATFHCGAAFYLADGGSIGVSQVCPSPSYVAVKAMEKQAEDDVYVSGPHLYHPSVMHMGDCSICGNLKDHPNHLTKAVAK